MPWARLDDDFHDNGKILSLSHQAFRLYVCAITYSRRHRTEGMLTGAQVGALCRQQRVTVSAIADLIEATAWHREDGLYRIHDFQDYQPGEDETNAERQQRYRDRRKASRNAVTPTVTTPVSNGPVTRYGNAPVPIPVPIVTTEAKASVGGKPPSEIKPAPKPSVSPATLTAHQALWEAVAARFKPPANDAERGRYARAVKLFSQASVAPEEVAGLADELEERWPNAECSPLAVASNVTALRTPKPVVPRSNGAGHQGPPSKLAQNAAIFRSLIQPEEARG